MTRWEYLSGVLTWKSKDTWSGKINGEEVRGIDAYCNFYGQYGWELVSITQTATVAMVVVFKRLQEEPSFSALPAPERSEMDRRYD